MLQLDTDDNFLLDTWNRDFVSSSSSSTVQPREGGDQGAAGIVALVYEPRQQMLAAASASGKVCLFKHWLSKAHAAMVTAAGPVSQWQPSHCFWVSAAGLRGSDPTSSLCVLVFLNTLPL
jgi:hypothetical protein